LPVVTTRVGGNPQLVRNGEDGFLVPFWDATALRTAILDALGRGWDRTAIAVRGSRRQWDEVAGAVLEEFRAALQ
jgi:glycosyltransferase involved in cell wall biosynthesis